MSFRKPCHGGRPFWMRTSGPTWNGFTGPGTPLASASGRFPSQFSLTHTDGLVACAVSPVCPLGIDAEARKRRPVPGEGLEEILAPSELELLRSR